MKTCTVCKKTYDHETTLTDPAEQAGLFFSRELYKDVGELCPACLANRGQLAMMYCREFD